MSKKLFLLIVFAGFLNWYFSGGETVLNNTEFSKVSADEDDSVTLYATKWCGYCKKAREFLAENNIDYYEYDIETSESGALKYKALNGRGIPLLVVNSEVIRGYKPNAIIAALNKE